MIVVVASMACPTQSVASSPDDDMELLRATQVTFRNVAESMRPYLVRIETVGGSQPRGPVAVDPDDEDAPGDHPRRTQNPFQETAGSDFVVADGATTGIVYSADGYVIASSFNFVRDPVLISATFGDGRQLAARLVARDQVRKLALLRVEANNLPVPTWCDKRDVHVGQSAVALGLGFGGSRPSLTAGIVSAVGRMQRNAIQTDAKLSPANYGGPLCDLRGRIIGIAVPMAQRPGELAGIEMYDSGVGFVLPKDRVDAIVAELKTGRSFYRGWLGIQIDPRVQDAVVVGNVADPSPMRAAGVIAGDTILGIGDKPFKHFGHLTQALYLLPAGSEVVLRMKRDGGEFNVVVKLARNTELGELQPLEEPFDPSEPAP